MVIIGYIKTKTMKKFITSIIFILLIFFVVSCDECHDSNGKPYKYIIKSKYITVDGWEATTEEIVYLDNGNIKYYDEYEGWVILSEFTIKTFHCTK